MTKEALVARVDVIPVAHPLAPGARYGSARGLVTARAATLVRLETAGGVVGWGEGFGPPPAVSALVRELADGVVGNPVHRIVPFVRESLQSGYHRSSSGLHVCAISAIELALWDAWGRHLGVSVAELLGGRAREGVSAYASTGYVTEDADDEGAYTAQLHEAVAEGFRAVKVKLGLGRRRDRRRAEIARETIGPDRGLMVDFNGNYTADTALQVLDVLRDLDIDWVEEPVPPDDHLGLRQVRAARVPVAGGEAVYTRFGFAPLASGQLLDVLQPDLAKCGGLAEARTIVDLAHTWNRRVSPHVWGGAIGQAATMQLLAATPDAPHTRYPPQPLWLELDRGANRLRDGIVSAPVRALGGRVSIPEGPGFGIEIDEGAVGQLRAEAAT